MTLTAVLLAKRADGGWCRVRAAAANCRGAGHRQSATAISNCFFSSRVL